MSGRSTWANRALRHPRRWVEIVSGLHPPDAQPQRRIREDVRDGVYVMAFSCVASTVTALGLLALTRLAG